MSGSFESLRRNACVHRLDQGLYSHPKEYMYNPTCVYCVDLSSYCLQSECEYHV